MGILSSGFEPREDDDTGFSFFIIVCCELLLSALLTSIVDLEMPLFVLKL
jgi:hypothetical protein